MQQITAPTRLFFLIACLALPATLAAQRTDSLALRRELAHATAPVSIEELRLVRSDHISRALQSPESLYAFVTRAEPFYLERRAAAAQSKGLIPVEWVPRLWRAIGELRREESMHSWGLRPHPYSAVALDWFRADALAPRMRTILGARWTRPNDLIDHPLTAAELERAPWPWQALQALMDVRNGLIPSTYSPLERDKADAYLAVVLTMPCSTDEDAQLFVEAAQTSSHFKTPAVMGALRNIALNRRHVVASIQAAGIFADVTRLWDDSRAWSIGAAGVLAILRDSSAQSQRASAAYWIRSLREGVGRSTVKRPVPAGVIIEASRLALDPKSADAWTRLYTYAFSVIEALDDTPFAVERNLSPESPRVAELLSEFGRWFASHRAGLEQLAREQRPELDAAERLMMTTKCR